MKQVDKSEQNQQSILCSKNLKRVCSKSKLTEIIEDNLSEKKKVFGEEEEYEDMLSMSNNFLVS